MLTEKIDPKEQIQKEDIKKSKTLIIHLNSYLETENNLQKIKILVKIYQNISKYIKIYKNVAELLILLI